MFVKHIREIHVEPTTVCQAECSMCARTVLGYHKNKSLNSELTLSKFQELVTPALGNLEKVLFCGTLGDPASAIELLDMIRWLQSERPGIIIGMNTNGGLRTRSWWDELASLIKLNPLSYVVFSIDGLADTNHIYRKNVAWAKLMANVESFIDAGGVAQWDMLVFNHNKGQVEAATELAREMGFRAFRTKVSGRFADHDTDLAPPDGVMPEEMEDRFGCPAKAGNSVYLSAAGLWYPCCYTHDSHARNIDTSWGDPLQSINSRALAWHNLDETIKNTPLPVCNKNCGTTYRKGQWKTEVFFS